MCSHRCVSRSWHTFFVTWLVVYLHDLPCLHFTTGSSKGLRACMPTRLINVCNETNECVSRSWGNFFWNDASYILHDLSYLNFTTGSSAGLRAYVTMGPMEVCLIRGIHSLWHNSSYIYTTYRIAFYNREQQRDTCMYDNGTLGCVSRSWPKKNCEITHRIFYTTYRIWILQQGAAKGCLPM